MLKILFTITLSLATGIVFSQEKTKQVKTIDGSKYPVPSVTTEMLEYAKTNGSYITQKATGKDVQFDGEITLEIAQKVDPAQMGIAILNRGQIYTITGTDKMLIVKSTWVLDNEMKTAQ